MSVTKNFAAYIHRIFAILKTLVENKNHALQSIDFHLISYISFWLLTTT